MSLLHLYLLGGYCMVWDEKPLPPIRSRKARGLLAYLAAEGDHPHPRQSLCGLFWPESPERLAHQSLSQALLTIKNALPDAVKKDFLQITPQEIRLDLQNCQSDLLEFDALLKQCAAHAHASQWACRQCLQRLEQTADLYQGDFMGGFSLPDCSAFEEWLLLKRQSFLRKIIQVYSQLSQGFQLLNELEQALTFARKWVAFDSLDEAAHRQVMSLLSRLDRRGEALVQYAACQQVLADELGVLPDEETTSLYRIILGGLDQQAGDLSRTHNLPASTSSLVGRQQELETLCHLLADTGSRLVTVLGGGGMGKSHLALEAGRSLLPVFPDGVFWIELNTFQTDRSLAPLVCTALDLQSSPITVYFGEMKAMELRDQLIASLRHKQLLLILDGFEAMLHEVDLVANLLRRAPQIKILITSRALLNLQHEHVFQLEGLSYPRKETESNDLSQYSALLLFEQAAFHRFGSFASLPAYQAAVVEICRLMEGLPLGILLAASWVNILTPGQILEEIRRSLDFLSSQWRDLPLRQRSLTATFDYSFLLLAEPERTAFLRLSVFHDPFTFARASQITGTSLDSLRILIEQSLLQRSGEDRFRMHDMLRQYAMEKLAEYPEQDQAIHQRHCQVFLEALAAWEPRLKGTQQFDALDEMDLEYFDLLAAWDWAIAQDLIEDLEYAIEAFRYYHNLRILYREGEVICQKALTRLESLGIDDCNLRLWLQLALWKSSCHSHYLEYPDCWQIIRQMEDRLSQVSLARAELWRERARLSISKAWLLLMTNKVLSQIIDCMQQSLDMVNRLDDGWEISHVMQNSSVIYGLLGDIHANRRMSESALAFQYLIGDPFLTSEILTQLSLVQMMTGEYRDAIRTIQEMNALRQHLKDRLSQAQKHSQMGLALYYAGQYEQSRLLCQKALSLFARPEQQDSIDFYRLVLHMIALITGDYEAVLQNRAYDGQIMNERDRWNSSLAHGMVHIVFHRWSQAEIEIKRYLEKCRQDILGVPLTLLGYIAYRRGQLTEAYNYLIQALENGATLGFFWGLCLSLATLAMILCENGNLETGAELYSVASAHPAIGNSRFVQDAFGKYIEPLVSQLHPEVLQAAQERSLQQTREGAAREWLKKLRDDPSLISP